MSYVKTNWVNNTTPINATNLNKIENELETLDTSLDEYSQYSTNEIRVGTWIDGKPIYRKVGIGTSATGLVTVNMGLSNIDTITSFKGVYYSAYPIPYSTDTAGFTIETYRNGANIGVIFGSSIATGKPFNITIEYTKTTD